MAPYHIGMETCCGAHHLGRQLLGQGHDVRLMPPTYVQPFVKRDKNDTKDAEAGPEARLRPTIRFVAVKSEPQRVNQTHGFLLERGFAIPQGKHRFAARLPEILEDVDNGLGDRMRALPEDMVAEWDELRDEDPGHRPRTGGGSAAERGLRAAAGGAGHRDADGDGTGGGGGGREGLRKGARPGGLARADARGALDGGQVAPGRHQQPRQPLPADTAGALRPLGPRDSGQALGRAGELAATHAQEQGPTHGDRGAGRQPGADRLGPADKRPEGSQPSRSLRQRAERPRTEIGFVCHAQSMDKQVEPASRKPVSGNGPPRSRLL